MPLISMLQRHAGVDVLGQLLVRPYALRQVAEDFNPFGRRPGALLTQLDLPSLLRPGSALDAREH
eukprot:1196013-Pyramimonas_sp.AAC.1